MRLNRLHLLGPGGAAGFRPPRLCSSGGPRGWAWALARGGWGRGGRARGGRAAPRRARGAPVRAGEGKKAPASELWPDTLADAAREMGARHGLEVEVLGPDEMEAEGYRLLLGVGMGSSRPPRLIRAQYRGSRPGAGVN